jgi:hypothetical protein
VISSLKKKNNQEKKEKGKQMKKSVEKSIQPTHIYTPRGRHVDWHTNNTH